MTERTALQLLERHLDLLPPEKQSLARWLCEGGLSSARLPEKLRQRVWHVLPSGDQGTDWQKRVLRELVLDLLSNHRREIARRERVGGSRRSPLGPILVWTRRT